MEVFMNECCVFVQSCKRLYNACTLFTLNTSLNKTKWNSQRSGSKSANAVSQVAYGGNSCVFYPVKWSIWCCCGVCVHVCVRGGSNVGISWLIPIKTCGLLFSVSLVYCVMLHDFFRPISELLSHQQAEMPGCCGSWQSSRGGWYRGETVQSEEKSSLSRALAKSREEKERQREREEWGQGGRKEDKRQVAYGSHMVQQLDI